MTTVVHGFEPIRHDLDNRGLVAAYRAAGDSVGRVVVREPIGSGILSSSKLSTARIVLGADDRGTEPAEAMLSRIGRMRRPRTMAEAAAVKDLRDLCRRAIEILGPNAAILHGTHCSRSWMDS